VVDVPITAAKMAAWVAFVHANAQVLRRLSDDLDASGQIPLTTYDVLVQLSEAGGSLRLRDLLERLVVVSQPGLSRRVERLEAAGLVERHPDPDDGRGVIVSISKAGRASLRGAAKVHVAGINREFAERISEDEALVLRQVFERIQQPPA
jgi:DNA-binding MarR family transcriptional regulator